MADDMTKLNVTSAMNSAASGIPAAPISASGSSDTDGADDPFAETKSELISRYELLPDDIKAVIIDAGYQKKLFDLAKSQKLTYEELGVIETETTMVLLGMTKPADYRDELQSELKKNDPEIDAIVKAVNEQIFTPIRASLERVYEAKKDPADYIPVSIVTGVEEKPAEPVFPESAPAIHSTIPGTSTMPRASVMNAMPFPSSSLSSAEKTVLENTGVVIETVPKPVAPVMQSEIPNRSELLRSIENPRAITPDKMTPSVPSAPAVAPKPMFAGPTISATKTTDYSMPAKSTQSGTTPAPTAPRVDPYREPID